MDTGFAWPAADRLFCEDTHWVGGDSANSVQIADDRVLWIFADSFISPSGLGSRTVESVMINNAVGIQDGLDPTTSSMQFYWRTSETGRPASYFRYSDDGYLWPCNCIVLDGRVLLFAMRVRTRKMTAEERENSPALSSFQVFGWVGILIENPLDDPTEWRVSYLDSPSRFGRTLGVGSLFIHGPHLYAHATPQQEGREQYLARWTVEDASSGRLAEPEWWCGPERGWVRESAVEGTPADTVEKAHTEFTVHQDLDRLLWVQMLGIVHADIGIRMGDRPEGPWTEFAAIYHPPEGDADGGFVYGAKAHPELHGADGDLILTYNNNSMHGGRGLIAEPELYYPRFVRVRRDRGRGGAASSSSRRK